MTGPLYTIHKIISIIKLAKEQEEQLQKPVIPIFWIAGEDHDYLEVNHVYIEKDNELQKVAITKTPLEKTNDVRGFNLIKGKCGNGFGTFLKNLVKQI